MTFADEDMWGMITIVFYVPRDRRSTLPILQRNPNTYIPSMTFVNPDRLRRNTGTYDDLGEDVIAIVTNTHRNTNTYNFSMTFVAADLLGRNTGSYDECKCLCRTMEWDGLSPAPMLDTMERDGILPAPTNDSTIGARSLRGGERLRIPLVCDDLCCMVRICLWCLGCQMRCSVVQRVQRNDNDYDCNGDVRRDRHQLRYRPEQI